MGAAQHPFDRFLATALPDAVQQRTWTPDDGPLPALYLGHGAPPLFEDPLWMQQLFGWAQGMPKPRGVLIVSAHWESAPLALSGTAAATPLVYDFGGFDRRYFEMTYPTPDASALARAMAAAMPDTEPVHEHSSRGLDHGAWVPLKVTYPGPTSRSCSSACRRTTRPDCWSSAGGCGTCARRGCS